MSIAAVAVCPHPPLLVPEIGGAATELDTLRAACDRVARRICAADVASMVVISAGATTRRYPTSSHGDFGAFGMPRVRVSFSGGQDANDAPDRLPLGQLVGAWLLSRVPGVGDRFGQTIADEASQAECIELGRRLAALEDRVGLLVMGDGAARHNTEKYAEADAFDQSVAAALATADTDALLGLDPDLAEELGAAGRAPWQVLAGAAGDQEWQSELLYADAPIGVGYFVASWNAS
jgi:aromatic ring-opening dioxygenase LigB subunit